MPEESVGREDDALRCTKRLIGVDAVFQAVNSWLRCPRSSSCFESLCKAPYTTDVSKRSREGQSDEGVTRLEEGWTSMKVKVHSQTNEKSRMRQGNESLADV